MLGSAISDARKAGSVFAFAAASPLDIFIFIVVAALPAAMRWVIAAAPSAETIAMGVACESTTSAVTLWPWAPQAAIAACAASMATADGIPGPRAGRRTLRTRSPQ